MHYRRFSRISENADNYFKPPTHLVSFFETLSNQFQFISRRLFAAQGIPTCNQRLDTAMWARRVFRNLLWLEEAISGGSAPASLIELRKQLMWQDLVCSPGPCQVLTCS